MDRRRLAGRRQCIQLERVAAASHGLRTCAVPIANVCACRRDAGGPYSRKRSGLIRSVRSTLIAVVIADDWFGLGARDCARNRAPDAPCLRGRRPGFLDPVARGAVRFAAVVGCSALEKAPLLPALAKTTRRSACRSGKMHVMSVSYVRTAAPVLLRVRNLGNLRAIRS